MGSRIDKQAYEDWLELCKRISDSTLDVQQETETQKEDRIRKLKGNFEKFCFYYFPHYCKSPFGWFHRKAAKEIINDKKFFGVLEWPREHAKSVFVDILIPLYLYAIGELDGMILVSVNEEKAKGLLGDLQAEFKSNNRFINDYGELARAGDWRDGNFSTTDGIGFWAFGRGQSPRGTRKYEKRPNYAVIDDIDDKAIVKNQQRVKEMLDWIKEALYGALSIKGGRLVMAGNRINKLSILAHMVGNIEPTDPVNPHITHIPVYAIEKGARHRKADFHDGQPAWKENYTLKQLKDKMKKMGFRAARREFFHEHHEEGHVFKPDWIHWNKALHWKKYDAIIVYCDPSWKGTKKNDYKAIVTLGKKDGKYMILDAWVRQASVKAMIAVFYDIYAKYGNAARYYMEGNFMQDTLVDEVYAEGEQREEYLPLRADKRKKPDKYDRIENMSPFFERGLMEWNDALRQSPDMQELKNQFLGFPYGYDDGPDATEGGLFYLQKIKRSSRSRKPRMGRYKKSNNRYG